MKRLLLLFLLALIAVGCAQDIGTIDRTQPNRIKKSFFEGEWFMRQTVVDVPFNTGFSFIGEQGNTELIQWDIQKSYLIGYRTYEHNPGTEAYLHSDGEPYGTVCKSSDNELKILGFNEDCPDGFELVSKKAFYGTPVVAFSINKHFDIIRQYNSSTGEQSNVIVENTSDRPWYERDYIRVDWSKNLIADFQFGSPDKIPQQPVSFYCSEDPNDLDEHCRKWKPYFEEKDGEGTYFYIAYKVLAQPETFNYYGGKLPACYLYSNMGEDCLGQEITFKIDFMKKRSGDYQFSPVEYDDNKMKKFGYFRTEKYVFDRDRGFLEDAKKYYANLFDIFERDSDGNPTGVKPIIYYVNRDFPEELLDAAEWIANGRDGQHVYDPESENFLGELMMGWDESGKQLGWNDVFKKVASQVLCDGASTCDKYSGEDLFIVCENPVRADSHSLCGEEGFSPMIGDLRYNLIYWIKNPQKSSPLGYGPNAPDPVTGKVLSANAFIYGNELEYYAQYVLDLVDLLRGETEISDYVSGRYIAKYLEDKKYGDIHPNPSLNIREEIKPDLSKALTKLQPKIRSLRSAIEDKKLTSSQFVSRMDKIKGTGIEDMLINNDIKALFNPSKDYVEMEATDLQRETLSPTNWLNPKLLKKREEFKRVLARKTILMNDFVEDTMLGLAKMLAKSGKTKEEMYQFIQKEIFYGTTIHEVGHNLGLRHNFASHTDALNFFPEYWNIRLDQLDNGGTFAVTGVQPRYREEFEDYYETMMKRQYDKGITEYQYTSIMDYGGRANCDFKGLGSYDVAAIMYAYANSVQVFNRASAAENNLGYKDHEDIVYTQKYRHYTRVLYDILDINSIGSYVNNKEKNLDALYGHRAWRKVDSLTPDDVEIPFAFCSDEYHSGTYKCYRFALGVDMYESIIHQEQYYDNWYFITNFKAGRARYGYGNYFGRIYGRFDFIANQMKHWVYEGLIARDPDDGWYGNTFDGEDLTIGSYQSLDFFANVLGRVKPGFYTLNSDTNYYELSREKDYLYNWEETAENGEIEVPLGMGRYQTTKYDPEMGYDFYYQPVVQGVWLDKVVAMMVLGDDMTNFMGIDASADSLSFAIAYVTLFSEDIMRMLAGVVLDKPEYTAPYVYNGDIVPADGIHLWTYEGDDYADNKDDYRYLKPENPFMVKLYALYLGNSYFTDTTRFDFGKSLEINVVGAGDSPELDVDPMDSSYIQVEDPISHKIYYTVDIFASDPSGDDELPRVSIGYEMLKDFEQVVNRYNTALTDYENGSITEEEFQTHKDTLQEKRTYINFVVSLLHLYRHPYW